MLPYAVLMGHMDQPKHAVGVDDVQRSVHGDFYIVRQYGIHWGWVIIHDNQYAYANAHMCTQSSPYAVDQINTNINTSEHACKHKQTHMSTHPCETYAYTHVQHTQHIPRCHSGWFMLYHTGNNT